MKRFAIINRTDVSEQVYRAQWDGMPKFAFEDPMIAYVKRAMQNIGIGADKGGVVYVKYEESEIDSNYTLHFEEEEAKELAEALNKSDDWKIMNNSDVECGLSRNWEAIDVDELDNLPPEKWSKGEEMVCHLIKSLEEQDKGSSDFYFGSDSVPALGWVSGPSIAFKYKSRTAAEKVAKEGMYKDRMGEQPYEIVAFKMVYYPGADIWECGSRVE